MQPRKRNINKTTINGLPYTKYKESISTIVIAAYLKRVKIEKNKLPSTTHCQGLYRILFTYTIYMLIASQTFTVHSPPQQFPRRAMSSKITSPIATQQDYQANVSGQP